MEEQLTYINNTLNNIVNMLEAQSKGTLNLEETIQYSGIKRSRLLEVISKENTDFPYFKNGKKILVNKQLLDEWLIKVAKEHRVI